MARHTHIVITLALVATLFLSVQPGGATVAYSQMQDSLDQGLAWLEAQQNLDDPAIDSYGSWGDPYPAECTYNHRVEKTSIAMIKLLDRSRELREPPAEGVQDGLGFIFRKVQDDGSIWDYFSLEYCGFETAPDTVTETSLAIMAIVRNQTPTIVVSDTGSSALGKTQEQVVEEAVAYLAWAQRNEQDGVNFGDVGGWTGGKDSEGTIVPYFVDVPADQVHTGIASLALIDAKEKSGVTIPPDTITRLALWVDSIQDYPGSGGAYYWAPPFNGFPYIHYTGDLLIEQHLIGRTPASDDVLAAVGFIAGNWNLGNYNYMDYFLMTRGLSLVGVGTFPGSTMDWFDTILEEVIPDQTPGGYWPEDFGDTIRPTEWALLTIEGHVYPGEMMVAKSASATEVSAGDTVTYTYKVQNTGRSAIYDLSLDDDRLGNIGMPDAGMPESIDDGDTLFEPGELWVYTRDTILSSTTTNIGTASGVDLLSRDVVAQSDPVTVTVNLVTVSAISVELSASAPLVHAGDDVTYTYLVSNAADNPLLAVTLEDDRLGPIDTLVAGDDGDSVLEQGETWTYTITVPVTAKVTNTATVTGTDPLGVQVSDTSDPVSVNVINPSIDLVKTASADVITPGDEVTYTYRVTNAHDNPLFQIILTDDKIDLEGILPEGDDGNNNLDPGEVW
ncbi:MAG: DUF11 domain-containing protein, partial [Methanomicrobiales archaeon]|nr:DUF11 domain-containing protein [Methanomicrobiales archaeon]